MGKKNDYLTVEDSAQFLGKPTFWIKEIISRGELGAKLSGGRWLIALRDLDKLRANLVQEPKPEKTRHNFLAGIPPEVPHRPPKTELAIKEKQPSATRPGPPKFSPKESELRKQVDNFNKQIRGLKDRIRAEQYERHKKAVASKSHPSEVVLNGLLSQQQQLRKQRGKAQIALNKEIQSRKEQSKKVEVKQPKKVEVKHPKKVEVKQPKKVKVKQPKNKKASRINEQEEAHQLYWRILATQRRIKLEFRKCLEAKQKGKVFDVTALKRLKLEREALVGKYTRIGEPQGPLPPLGLTGNRVSKLSKRPPERNVLPVEFQRDPPSSTIPTRHLSWRVLPPGELSVDSISRHYDRLQRQNPRIKYERERIVKAFSLGPKECYVGKNEFEGYVVFTFAHTTKALLECPLYGNAIYIIDSDWKRWSRMSKQELLSSSHEVTRIIHRGNWFSEVKRELKRR